MHRSCCYGLRSKFIAACLLVAGAHALVCCTVGAIVGVAVGGAVLAAAAALAAYCFVQKRRKAARAPSVPSARHINTEAEPVAQASAINATAAPVQPTDKPADVGAATHVTASANAGY